MVKSETMGYTIVKKFILGRSANSFDELYSCYGIK
jgi:hypothetical protein